MSQIDDEFDQVDAFDVAQYDSSAEVEFKAKVSKALQLVTELSEVDAAKMTQGAIDETWQQVKMLQKQLTLLKRKVYEIEQVSGSNEVADGE